MSDLRESNLASLRRMFKKYIELGGNWDDHASRLTPFILEEVGFAVGSVTDAAKMQIAKGKEAVDLLKLLPQYPGRSSIRVPIFPNTRYILWRHVIHGICYGKGKDLEEFIQAIVSPGRISPEETQKLRDAIKDETDEHATSDEFRKRICKALKENTYKCNYAVFRALLHFLASKGEIEDLQDLIS